MSDDFLKHYGVKGMKWGIRKRDQKRMRRNQGPSDDAKKAHKAYVKAKVVGVEALTNRELNALNNRLNLEQNYSRLSYSPGKLKRGMDAVSGLLGAGKTVNEVVKFAESPAGKKLAAKLSKEAAEEAAKKAKG